MPPKSDKHADVHTKYQKLSPREHILLRPEMYIGAVVEEDVTAWAELAGGTIKRVPTRFSQGMMKVVDEILVNASDNILEHAGSKHPVTRVELSCDPNTGKIKVENDGPGIPVVKHEEHDLWIPEMVFGHLLTGKNFHNDDAEGKMAAGRHGYGAKLTNIFATKFKVTTVCEGKKYTQQWSDNMAVEGAPVVVDAPKADDMTAVEFTPDFPKLGMSGGLSNKFIAVLRKRFADLAVCHPSVSFVVNGTKLTSDFTTYIKHYSPDAAIAVEANSGKQSQFIGFAYFEKPSASLKGAHVSMVNGVVTYNGGTHIEHAKGVIEEAALAAAAQLLGDAAGGTKEFNLQKFMSHCIVFTSVYVSQPKFDSQSKVRLVSSHKWASFDSAPIVKSISKIKTLDKYIQSVFSGTARTKTSSTNVRNKVTKVHDAVYAGKPGYACTLLVTEGDSAAALAVGSLSVEQRKTFGVFPVRGKVMNVLSNIRHVPDNKEWMDLFTVVGLSLKERDPSLANLRYQRIIIMTDQDHDGTHIRGLLLAGLHELWPRLAKTPGFVGAFTTPIVKAFPKGKAEQWFESIASFNEWRKSNASTPMAKAPRYYKGLGTSTTAEGKIYFSKLPELIRPFTFDPTGEGKLVDSFHPSQAHLRREWLAKGRLELGDTEPAAIPAPAAITSAAKQMNFEIPTKAVKLADFVDNDLRQFALYDNSRMVPSMVDGLKTSSRKILDGALQHQKTSMRVSQLAGLISQKMAYHHGEVSLIGVIIGFAQEYTTANNFPLMTAEGQFGSRLVPGGKDHAAPRYIFTQLRDHTLKMFPRADLHHVDRVTDDGEVVEPFRFAPVVPFALVNGIVGITVGHRVEVHPRHPEDIIAVVRAMIANKGDAAAALAGRQLRRHFTGSLGTVVDQGRSMTAFGAVVITSMNDKEVQLRVVDVQQGVSAEKFRGELAKQNNDGVVKSYFEYSTTEAMDFDVTVKREVFDDKWQGCPYTGLKLSKTFHENLVMFDSENRLVEDTTAELIFAEHYKVRHATYVRRLKQLREDKQHEADIARGTYMFVKLVNEETIPLATLTDEPALVKALITHKVPRVEGSFGYLTRLSISRLFKQSYEAAREKAEKLAAELHALQHTTPEALWTRELGELETVVKAYEKERLATVVSKLELRAPLGKIHPIPAVSEIEPSTPARGGGGGGDGTSGGGARGGRSSGGRGRGRGRGRGGRGGKRASLGPVESSSVMATPALSASDMTLCAASASTAAAVAWGTRALPAVASGMRALPLPTAAPYAATRLAAAPMVSAGARMMLRR